MSAAVTTKAPHHTGDAPFPRNAKDSGGTPRSLPLKPATYLMDRRYQTKLTTVPFLYFSELSEK